MLDSEIKNELLGKDSLIAKLISQSKFTFNHINNYCLVHLLFYWIFLRNFSVFSGNPEYFIFVYANSNKSLVWSKKNFMLVNKKKT